MLRLRNPRAIRRKAAAWNFLENAARVAASGVPALSEEEVQAEIKALRKARRRRAQGLRAR